MAGASAHAAALQVRAKALAIAGHLLEAAAQDLDIEGGTVHVRGTDRAVTLGEVARTVAGTAGYSLPPGITPGLEATEHVVIDDMAYANGTIVAEVEVDTGTGGVTIRRLVALHDCGRVVNPLLADGQILGGTAHGLGNALYEWMGYDADAQPVTTNLGEYLLVTATDMPQVELLRHESPSPLNALVVKGVGECGVIAVAPSVVSAIEDALSPFGVRIDHAPVTPMQVMTLIAAAEIGSAHVSTPVTAASRMPSSA